MGFAEVDIWGRVSALHDLVNGYCAVEVQFLTGFSLGASTGAKKCKGVHVESSTKAWFVS